MPIDPTPVSTPRRERRQEWLVAVDDDPTGCQSVSGIPIVTAWDQKTLTEAAKLARPVTFVLTNSRSLTEQDAVRVNAEVGENLAAVAQELDLDLRLLSRSDSTLRGHFPAETQALAEGSGVEPDGIIICPAFFEAGRYTAGGIHWVLDGNSFVPARDTEFANDETFGFDELKLSDWVDSRLGVPPAIELSLQSLATGGQAAVLEVLRSASSGQPIVVNALNYDHLDLLASCLGTVEQEGHQFIYRTGPSFVRSRAGLGAPAVVDLTSYSRSNQANGLVAVGSHTALTNRQVANTMKLETTVLIELEADLVMDPNTREQHIVETADRIAGALQTHHVVARTSRTVLRSSGEGQLDISQTISAAFTGCITQACERYAPAWVIAKGGITSHDLLTKAFGVRLAMVVGQALPGIIPVLEVESPDGHWPYLIFPGNVGDHATLAQVVALLTG